MGFVARTTPSSWTCCTRGSAEASRPKRLRLRYETANSFYILMEYVMGGTLRQLLQERGRFDRAAARFYVGSLILVLEVLHDRDIVHRDLKPENVMIDGKGYVKLIDFGIAKRLKEERRSAWRG